MEVSGKRSDIIEVGAAEELEKLCEVCEVDHVTTKANGICRECEQYMCDKCFTTHIKVKSCRQHVLVDTEKSVTPVQRSVENVEKCKHHLNETIKFYCRKHETVGCGECMIPGHFTCQPENIKDLSKGFQQNEDFKRLTTKIETVMSANKENDKKVQESQKENENMLKKALKEIKTFRAEINNYLDKAEESILKEAKAREHDNNKLLAKLEKDCTLLSSRMTDMMQKLDAEIYQDSALFIQTVDCKPRVLDIERECSRIQRENDIKTFEFVPDKQLQGIINATVKLGSLTKPVHTPPTKPDTTAETKVVSSKEATDDKRHSDKNTKKEKEIPIIVKTLPGMEITVNASLTDTIGTVQIKIRDKTGISTDAQRLRLKGIVLEENRTLIDYNISKGSKKHLIIGPKTGPAADVAVGARVRPIGMYIAWHCGAHKYQSGTVTAVNSDGTVNVKWDASGQTWANCGIGLEVELM